MYDKGIIYFLVRHIPFYTRYKGLSTAFYEHPKVIEPLSFVSRASLISTVSKITCTLYSHPAGYFWIEKKVAIIYSVADLGYGTDPH